MYNIGWKDNYFRSAEVYMIVNGCGYSIYPQFYDIIDRTFKNIPPTYSNYVFGIKGDEILKEKWCIDLAYESRAFLWQCIDDMREILHW